MENSWNLDESLTYRSSVKWTAISTSMASIWLLPVLVTVLN